MDGWGALTMLIKKQEAAKNRKAVLKYELQKRREGLLKGSARKEMEFPEISNAEMAILKEEIRKKYKAERIKSIIINIILLIFVVFIFYFIIRNKIKF